MANLNCFVIFILIFLFPFTAFSAEVHTQSQKLIWSDSFKIDKMLFEIQGISKSGDINEDDMTIMLLQNGRSMKVPVSLDLYDLVRPSSDLKSLSEKIPIFKIGPSEILIFLFPNGRPLFNKMTFVGYDFKGQNFFDVKENIGDLKDDSFVFISDGPNQYKIRLIKEHLNSVPSDGPEVSIEDWMIINYSKRKLQYHWK